MTRSVAKSSTPHHRTVHTAPSIPHRPHHTTPHSVSTRAAECAARPVLKYKPSLTAFFRASCRPIEPLKGGEEDGGMLYHTPVGSHIGRPHDGLDGRLPARVAQAEERIEQQWLRLGMHGVGWVCYLLLPAPPLPPVRYCRPGLCAAVQPGPAAAGPVIQLGRLKGDPGLPGRQGQYAGGGQYSLVARLCGQGRGQSLDHAPASGGRGGTTWAISDVPLQMMSSCWILSSVSSLAL